MKTSDQASAMLPEVRRELARARIRRTRMRESLQATEAEIERLETLEHALMYALGQVGSPERKRDGLVGWRIDEKAVALLRSAGEPLHYRELWRRLAAEGVTIASSDPEAVLLTRLTRHPDVERAGRGIYVLRAEAEAA